MKRTLLLTAAITLMALAAAAQELEPAPPPTATTTTAVAPDFSRDTLLRLLADQGRDEPEPTVQFGNGTVSFKALGQRWRFIYLPFFAPWQGGFVNTNREWPDPFVLTGTAYASPPSTWHDQRAMSKELKKIEKRIKATVKVGTSP